MVYMWGQTGAADKLGQHLMPDLDLGDWIFYENMGSYTMSLWTPFLGFPKPKVYYFLNYSRRYIEG